MDKAPNCTAEERLDQTYAAEDAFDQISLQAVIDSIDEVIALVDAEKIVRMINHEARRILKELAGLEPENLVGHPVDEVLAPFIYDGISVVAMSAEQGLSLQKNVRYVIEEQAIDKTILYSAIPIKENGRLQCVVAIGRDMTRLIRLEERLAAVERLNQYYSAMVSDLRDDSLSDRLIFSSKKMEEILKLAGRVSQSDASVFITGESGVGKEEIAKYIHKNSKRKDGPYLAVNCAAIPKELMESELFGYVEGAFTGSRRGGKRGILEEVDGGTLFFDEIGDLSPELQGKLLRVLQLGTFRPIGSNRDISADVRYISATNIPYENLLDNAKFRQDLLYRLSVIPISIPPIRERREDIAPLVEYFLNLYNIKYKRQVQFTARAYNHLCALPWRGNVRQIKNVIERVVILSEDGLLLYEDLLPILRMDIDSAGTAEESSVRVTELTTLAQAQTQMEKQLIALAMEEFKTVPKAAKALGVPPSTIYRKINK